MSSNAGWYYKLFDAEFGPVTFDELVELAKSHSLSVDDEVRLGEEGIWRRAGSIGQLMTHLPYQAASKATPVASPAAPSLSDFELSDTGSGWSNDDDFETTAAVEPPKADDRWYCKILGNEVGPMTFEQLEDMAKNHTMSRDDEVRFGEGGLWRRAGSMGPLMAHFPFEAAKRVIETGKRDSKGQIDVVNVDEPIAPVTSPAPSPVVQQPSTPEPAASKDDQRFWCLIQDREYGPVDLAKIMEWAESGRLHSYDHVRMGRNDYVVASEIPGLFPKRPESVSKPSPSSMRASDPSMNARSAESESRSKAATDSAMSTMSDTMPAIAPMPERPPTPAPMPSSSGFGGSSASMATRSAPPAAIRRPPAKSSSGGTDIMKLLTGPIGMGVGGVVVLGALIYFGMPLIFGSADAGRFKSMAAAFNATIALRGESADAAKIKTAQDNLAEIAKKVAEDLKGSKKSPQSKLLALANKMLDFSKRDISKPDPIEQEIATKMKTLAAALNVK